MNYKQRGFITFMPDVNFVFITVNVLTKPVVFNPVGERTKRLPFLSLKKN